MRDERESCVGVVCAAGECPASRSCGTPSCPLTPRLCPSLPPFWLCRYAPRLPRTTTRPSRWSCLAATAAGRCAPPASSPSQHALARRAPCMAGTRCAPWLLTAAAAAEPGGPLRPRSSASRPGGATPWRWRCRTARTWSSGSSCPGAAAPQVRPAPSDPSPRARRPRPERRPFRVELCQPNLYPKGP